MPSFEQIKNVIRRSSRVDERRARYTIYVSWVLLPVIVLFPMFQSYTGLLAGVILALSAVILVANFFVYYSAWETGRRLLPILGAAVAAFALLYFLWLGYEQGASFVWIFVFPLLVMFMLGIFWGAIGSVFMLVMSVIIMIGGSDVGSYDYSSALIIRFGLSFGMVSALALGFEYWRVAIEMDREEISSELDQVRIERDALKGLARVCSWCSSVRSDDGLWMSLESYVSEKEDAEITHSICPNCAEKQASRIKPG